MKDVGSSWKMKATFSALHPPKSNSNSKCMSMNKNRGTPSKTEEKRSLVATRLAMLQREMDAISTEEQQLTREPVFEPLAPFKSANLKRVGQLTEESSHSDDSSAMKRAEEVQASLSSEHPSFIRVMLPSHVASGFWLGLSPTFCRQHFPTSDTVMELIDETGKSFHAKYMAAKPAFSGGWRGFSVAHNLEEGDIVVFQLIKKTKLKVYIIRRNALGEPDGATGLQESEAFEDVLMSNDDEKDANVAAEAQEQHPDSCVPASGGKEQDMTLSRSPDSEVVDWIRRLRSKSVNLEGFGSDVGSSSKMKATFSALHPPNSNSNSNSKCMSMSKIRGIPSKTEVKRTLVATRLAMLQQDMDSISKEEQQLTPEPAFEPLTPFKSANLKRVRQSREESSHSNESSAMKRAQEVQASLSSEHPSFIRVMLHSHVASSFWLGLSKTFCHQHFPTSDTMMELIDESGKSFHAKYLAAKTAFSGGWKGFSVVHNLEEGDVVVFQLIKKTTLKVYIIRRNASGETDGATELQESEAFEDVLMSNNDEKDDNVAAEAQEQHPDRSTRATFRHYVSGGKEQERIRRSKSKSVNLEGFGKFSILLEGSVSIDAKFPEDVRRKYYDICTKQKSFLHEKLQKGLNCTLVVGIINETINISDAIRAHNCSTRVPLSDLLEWDTTLQSFQLVGMNVSFLRAQIHQLLGRTLEHNEAAALEARAESELACKRMKTLDVKFLEMKKQMEEINEEIKMTHESMQRSRVKLQQMNLD